MTGTSLGASKRATLRLRIDGDQGVGCARTSEQEMLRIVEAKLVLNTSLRLATRRASIVIMVARDRRTAASLVQSHERFTNPSFVLRQLFAALLVDSTMTPVFIRSSNLRQTQQVARREILLTSATF